MRIIDGFREKKPFLELSHAPLAPFSSSQTRIAPFHPRMKSQKSRMKREN